MSFSEIIVVLAADVLVVPVVVIGGIVMLLLPKKVRYERIGWGIITGLSALLFAKIASLLYQDGARPFEQLGVEPMASYLPNAGFPSDHTLLVFTATLVVWASTKNIKLTLLLLALSIIVAVGRVAALVHSPADVAGGVACALLAAFLVYRERLFTARNTIRS